MAGPGRWVVRDRAVAPLSGLGSCNGSESSMIDGRGAPSVREAVFRAPSHARRPGPPARPRRPPWWELGRGARIPDSRADGPFRKASRGRGANHDFIRGGAFFLGKREGCKKRDGVGRARGAIPDGGAIGAHVERGPFRGVPGAAGARANFIGGPPPGERPPWFSYRFPFRSQASLFIASTIISRILSASSMGTWHVPTFLCPPPPYFNIREPTSMTAVLLMMLYPQVITIFCFR